MLSLPLNRCAGQPDKQAAGRFPNSNEKWKNRKRKKGELLRTPVAPNLLALVAAACDAAAAAAATARLELLAGGGAERPPVAGAMCACQRKGGVSGPALGPYRCRKGPFHGASLSLVGCSLGCMVCLLTRSLACFLACLLTAGDAGGTPSPL